MARLLDLRIAVIVAAGACARAPAIVDDASAIAATPAAATATEPAQRHRGPRAIGAPDQLAAALAGVAGVWPYEGEIWQIEGERARVYRPRDQDIVVERTIEMIAPCMFVAHEGDALLGPYVVDHHGNHSWTSWTRGGVAAFRLPGSDRSVVCRAPEVYLLDGDRCEAWRYDLDGRAFESGPSCRLAVSASAPAERSIELVDALGKRIDEVPVPGVLIAGPTGRAVVVPNLASGCASFEPEAFGCTLAQAQALRNDYWTSDDGRCSGASLRVELDVVFAGTSVKVPSGCSIEPLPGEASFMLGPGVVVLPTQAVVQPGAETSLEYVFENTSAEPSFVRLPTSSWRFSATRARKSIELGGCRRYFLVDLAPPTEAVEYRLDPGGRLTVVAPWIAVTRVRRKGACEVEPLRPKVHELKLALRDDDDPAAVLTALVRVEGKPICDPCPDPWQ